MSDENTVKMVLPCSCPHCEEPIVITINQPYPTIDVAAPDEVPDNIKDVIENQDDITEEPEAA